MYSLICKQRLSKTAACLPVGTPHTYAGRRWQPSPTLIPWPSTSTRPSRRRSCRRATSRQPRPLLRVSTPSLPPPSPPSPPPSLPPRPPRPPRPLLLDRTGLGQPHTPECSQVGCQHNVALITRMRTAVASAALPAAACPPVSLSRAHAHAQASRRASGVCGQPAPTTRPTSPPWVRSSPRSRKRRPRGWE